MVEYLYKCERCGAATNTDPLKRLDLVLILCKKCGDGFKHLEQRCLEEIPKKVLVDNNSVARSGRIVKYCETSKDLLH